MPETKAAATKPDQPAVIIAPQAWWSKEDHTAAKLLELFREAVGDEDVKEREGWRDRAGKMHYVSYVEWVTVNEALDQICPTWENQILAIVPIGPIVAVIEEITVEIEGRKIRRSGVGTGSSETETGVKKADHDALKRAAVKFGVGRHLYLKESEAIERTGSANYQTGPDRPKPQKIMASGEADALSTPQLQKIRYAGKDAGVDPVEECRAEMGVMPEDLTKYAASWFIDHLKAIQDGVREPTYKKPEGQPQTSSTTAQNIEPDWVQPGHEGVPAGARPACWCKPPLPCRWVSGAKPGRSGATVTFAMWCCAKPVEDPERCNIRLNSKGQVLNVSDPKNP